jgi:aspartate/methionine/tyrosine aminotransferase
MPPDTLFHDDLVRTDILRERDSVRWGALPPDVIPLTAAEPDFPVAKEISESIQRYAASGHFFYETPHGRPGLKQVLSEVLRTRHAIPCQPEQLYITLGTAAAIYLVIQALCGPGDECIIMDPVDPWFWLGVDAARATRVYWRVDRRTGRFNPEHLRELITPRTRLITFCNPQNPLGVVMTAEELRAIAEIAIEHDLTILSDEVWSELVFTPHRHVSMASLGPKVAQRTFTLYGPSKTFGVPGLRVGCIAAPSAEQAQRMMTVAERLGSAQGHTSLAQVAVETAYRECWYWRDAFLAHLHQMREYCIERLQRLPGVSFRAPQGTYLFFLDITSFGMSSKQFADFLLQKARVALVPGSEEWFGPGGEGYVRLCFSTTKGVLKEAFDRMERALAELRR